MHSSHQLPFVLALVALSWLVMMAVHESGHVLGALLTGGSVQRVVLHPLRISRTDVEPNPHPGVVVWLGPMVGCALPLIGLALIPRRADELRKCAQFFAGFCLIANGAYIAMGSFSGVGDCAEMLRTGTPVWTMPLFGGLAMLSGLTLWHQLGSLKGFLSDPSFPARSTRRIVLSGLVLVVAIELLWLKL